jgi:hypothetical protein
MMGTHRVADYADMLGGVITPSSTAVFFGAVSGSSNFTGSGLKVFEGGAPSSLSAIASQTGDTLVDASTSVTAGNVRENALEVDGTLTITPDGTAAGTSGVNSLTVSATGRFDLTNNKLIVASGDVGTFNGSTYTGITGLIAQGRNGSALPLWDGRGIVTTQSQATTGNYTTLAISTATQAARAVFGGLSVAPSDVLVMYTYGGDATLDGKINIDDYVKIDSGIASHLTGWANGDFNYDGVVNIDDYTTVIDANIGNQNGVFFTAGGVVDGGGVSGVSAVPEPASLTILGLGAMGLMGSRRRRRGNATA